MTTHDSPLTADERAGIVIAVQSVFARLRKCYREVQPIYARYGFRDPSAGVMARDLSEQIETAIVQHGDTFERGAGYADLARSGVDWEVKTCKHSGLTINQSKQIHGEHYIVINYGVDVAVRRIWVLRHAHDSQFSPRRSNSNARALLPGRGAIEVLYPTGAAVTVRRAGRADGMLFDVAGR